MSVIDWALATERAAGRGGTYTDVINRPLREVLTISGTDPDASFVGFSLVGHTHVAAAITDLASAATGITKVGALSVGSLAAGFTAIADSFLSTIATAGKVSNSATTATSANTPSTIVARDASGNFTAGTITAALTGNASTATALAAARAINGVSFDGTAAITIKATATNVLTIGAHLTGSSYDGSAPITIATDATALNTVSTIVARDGSGNFAAGVITASFTGTLTGTASLANALANARLINGVAFNGSTDITVPAASATLTGTTLASNVVTSSLTGLGTVATGVWNATVIAPTFGGTGVANANTITIGGNISTAGAFSVTGGGLTLTLSGATSLTLPTSGTLVNTLGNVATASALFTPRAINGVNFDGSAAITVPAAATTLTGTTLAANVVTSSLTSVGTLTALTVSGASSMSTVSSTDVFRVTANSVTNAPASFGRTASQGTVITAAAGSSFDFVLFNPTATSPILSVPTGTVTAVFGGSVAATSLVVGPAASTGDVFLASASVANCRVISYATAGNATFVGRRSNGTVLVPLDAPNGGLVAALVAEAYSGSAWFTSGSMQILVDGTFTSGQAPPSRIEFYTNLANTAPALAGKFDRTGLFTLLNGLTLTGLGGGGGAVSVGAVDSGGSGFRLLRVPN